MHMVNVTELRQHLPDHLKHEQKGEEIAILFRKNRLALPEQHIPTSYMEDIIESLGLAVLQLTPAIAALAESGGIAHGDPGGRLIAATALAHIAPLIISDKKLWATTGLQCIW